ncbi:MAG: NAD(P)/FAD-dependent oxidoreductase [Bdellovibrionales bacterium]|nr:NAD(P)/FAD-dependent oxidoreductase [Bdellovibrionales bacterium]
MESKRVVIIGAGFAGVAVAQGLRAQNNLQITLVDRRNYHLFQPLLYQVAMAGLNPGDISTPLRRLFSGQRNLAILMAEVDRLDLPGRRIHYDNQWLSYDFLVVCCGSKHHYFGNEEWEEFSPGLKTIEQATEIRRRVLLALELAEKESDLQRRQELLTFVVVGGGPTGVEVAGAIAEMVRHTLVGDYKLADLRSTRVVLVEGGDRVLAAFPTSLSAKAEQFLRDLGVEVKVNSRAANPNSFSITINDEPLRTKTIIWAAGVRPSRLTDEFSCPKDRSGRIIVNSDFSVPGFESVFVIGDQAAFPTNDGQFLPALAPVAIQQGRHLARNISMELKGLPRKPFNYFDKGIMATVGRTRAVVSVGPVQLSGWIAWLIWVFVHIMYLVQVKNRVFVFLQWAWAYFSFGQGARLIVHKTWKFYSGEKIPIQGK